MECKAYCILVGFIRNSKEVIKIATTENLKLHVISEEDNSTVSEFFQKIAGHNVDSNFEIIDEAIKQLQEAPPAHTHSEMIGATASADGVSGYVPAPLTGNQTAFLRGDGTWSTPEGKNYSQGEGIEITSDYQIKNTGVLSVTAGENNGTLNVDGTEVPITGLGSSAFTDINDYAKAEHSHEDKMNVSAYDADGEIAAAGGIAEWIAKHYENAEVNTY